MIMKDKMYDNNLIVENKESFSLNYLVADALTIDSYGVEFYSGKKCNSSNYDSDNYVPSPYFKPISKYVD